MIKTFFIGAAALIALSGCAMPGTSKTATPGEVPASRIHIKQMVVPSAGKNEIRVTRDSQMMPGTSPLEFSINYVALADVRAGETISAWLPDGEYTFSVKPGVNSQKLQPSILTLKLQKGQKHTIRIAGGEFGVTIEEIGGK
jgi:hypothetical protein